MNLVKKNYLKEWKRQRLFDGERPKVVFIMDEINQLLPFRRPESVPFHFRTMFYRFRHWCETFNNIQLRPNCNLQEWHNQGVWFIDTLHDRKWMDHDRTMYHLINKLAHGRYSLPTVFVIGNRYNEQWKTRVEVVGDDKHNVLWYPGWGNHSAYFQDNQWGTINHFLGDTGRGVIDFAN
jgi:uracil DNA glycosylase